MVSHHLARFGGDWSCGSGGIAYLICNVTSQDHVTDRSCDVMGGTSSLSVINLPHLVALGIVVAEI